MSLSDRLARALRALLERLGADALFRAAADGGLVVATSRGGAVMLRSVIQLDGDIITFVREDLPRDAALAAAHFERVGRSLKELIASVNRLLAGLIALPTGVLVAATLPDALAGEAAAWIALLAEILAAVGGILLPQPRRLLSRLLVGPLLRWLLRARGRDLIAFAAGRLKG